MSSALGATSSPAPMSYANTPSPVSQALAAPANQSSVQQSVTGTNDTSTAASASAAVQKSGGTDPTSLLSQGQTSKGVLASASQGGGPQSVFKIQLLDNYASLVKPLVPSALKQADWYRDGEPSEDPDVQGPYATLPRMIDEYDNEETDTASIRVVNSKNEDLVPPYSKFILEHVTEGQTERSQIVETFGDFYVFLFGQRPPIYTYSGTLINTRNANWVSDFNYYYDNYLRGTKCVENNAVLVLTYAGTQVLGFMLNASYDKTATTQSGVRFNFQVVITDKKYLGLSADFASYVQGDQELSDPKVKQILDTIAGKEGKGTSAASASVAGNKVMAGMDGSSMSGVV